MAKRTGLGRGIGALIPTAEPSEARPVDVFFPGVSRRAVAEAALLEADAAKNADATDGTPGSNGSDAATAPTDVITPDTVDPDAAGTDAPDAPGTDAPDAPGTDAPDAPEGAANGSAPEAPAPELLPIPGTRLIHVDPNDIVPNPRQPRTNFDSDDLAELVHSVREFGVLQPVVVRTNENGQYELIMGERRTRASREAGLTSIPAIVRDTEDEHLLRDALLENLHRSQLNPLEEASAYQQLLEDFGITQEELATRIGRSRPQISNTIRLLKLPMPVQQRVAAGVLSAGHARAVLSLEDPEAMQRLADKIVNEDLSVRAAEAAAKSVDAGSTRRGATKAGARRAHLDEVAERLGDRLNTKVKINISARKGQVVIDFATIQDLNRILEEIGETEFGAR
ncbi:MULTISPECIES: ParB/RepB/Spo0J family partition protein [unclassified Microbacterium]|uniref:ParB/RepB/Spo0J family partition protein n=1 Tax=unclassified Microbacterium TaxID=2609290 RepID=UPI00214B8706|nr:MULTISPECIES: ParB/RepB/Spo0J family partition protein [unclassified Microbacterium]MCR2783068.1 ParB/RepB/Spo0J family partition protein [Microbacterium sp. zg.B96]WIM16047.1 ParB/RepB/Spo0J family partition protein [Microbacterium sp. zg-B96]